MRVLVFTPVLRERYFARHREALYAIEPLEEGGQVDYFQSMGGDTADHPYDNITRKCNEARDLVLQRGYDALLMVESDVIAPPEALRRLAAVEADVAYGLVVHTHGWPTWNASKELGEKMAVPISLFPEEAKAAWGKVIEVDGVGSSCVLIHRHVLAELRYWRKDTPEFQRSCDWYFSEDCLASGFVQKCDTTVICGHIETDTMPMIRWPDITRPGFYRCEVIGPMPEDIIERVRNEPRPNAGLAALPS